MLGRGGAAAEEMAERELGWGAPREAAVAGTGAASEICAQLAGAGGRWRRLLRALILERGL